VLREIVMDDTKHGKQAQSGPSSAQTNNSGSLITPRSEDEEEYLKKFDDQGVLTSRERCCDSVFPLVRRPAVPKDRTKFR
jgi:hypothetical protein